MVGASEVGMVKWNLRLADSVVASAGFGVF